MDKAKKEFSKIYDKYIKKIYRFIFLKVNSEDIAQDLCSDTFLKGWEAFKTQKIENPQAFLYKIARNSVIDYYREKGRTQVVSAEYASIVDPGKDIEQEAMLKSDIEQVKAVLANLNENHQNVIIWRYLDELSIQKIAKMMNKSEDNTRVILHRALKALKNELDNKTS